MRDTKGSGCSTPTETCVSVIGRGVGFDYQYHTALRSIGGLSDQKPGLRRGVLGACGGSHNITMTRDMPDDSLCPEETLDNLRQYR